MTRTTGVLRWSGMDDGGPTRPVLALDRWDYPVREVIVGVRCGRA